MLIIGATAVIALERSPYEDQRQFRGSTSAKEQLTTMH
jgi:hypothetical protein